MTLNLFEFPPFPRKVLYQLSAISPVLLHLARARRAQKNLGKAIHLAQKIEEREGSSFSHKCPVVRRVLAREFEVFCGQFGWWPRNRMIGKLGHQFKWPRVPFFGILGYFFLEMETFSLFFLSWWPRFLSFGFLGYLP